MTKPGRMLAWLAVLLALGAALARRRRRRNLQILAQRRKVAEYKVLAATADGALESSNYSARKVLITGGAGLLGSTIAAELLKNQSSERVKVFVLDMVAPSKRDPRITYITASILNLTNLKYALDSHGIESVLHCAALLNTLDFSDGGLDEVNIKGTANVVQACRECRSVQRLIFTSSAAAVLSKSKRRSTPLEAFQSDSENYPCERLDHFEHYGFTKAVGEQIVLNADCESNLATACLRPSIIFGARDGKLAQRLLQGLDNNLVGLNPRYPLDYVHVDDVARAHVLCERAMARDPCDIRGKAFHVGSSKPIKYREFMLAFGNGDPVAIPLQIVLLSAQFNQLCWKWLGVAPLSKFLTKSSVNNISSGWWFPTKAAMQAFGYQSRDSVQLVKQMVEEHNKTKLDQISTDS